MIEKHKLALKNMNLLFIDDDERTICEAQDVFFMYFNDVSRLPPKLCKKHKK